MALREARAFETRNSQILDPALYDAPQRPPGEADDGLQLVSVVSDRSQAESVLQTWASAKVEAPVRRAAMRLLLTEAGEAKVLGAIPPDVAVNRVKSLGVFASRTGIRVLPFSLIIANGDHVLAAGPGLPDAAFIRDTAERFLHEGSGATTVFRPVSLEVEFGLTTVEALFPSTAVP